MESILQADVVDEIKKIHIPMSQQEDMGSWHLSKDGNFTVRSAYYIQLQEVSCSPSVPDTSPKSIWNAIWKARLPNKIKNFAWRACKNGLPVNVNLACRGVETDVRCSLCGEGDETINHVMMQCSVARDVWYFSPLRLDFEGVPNISFKDVCSHLLSTYKDDHWWNVFWAVAWSLWLNRNLWCFEKKKREIGYIICRAVNLANEFSEENSKSVTVQQGQDSRTSWTPPHGLYKLNTDAGFVKGGRVGLGAILRDHEGTPVMASCWCIDGPNNVDLLEAMAARNGLSIALEAGFSFIILEVDSFKLYSHIHKKIKETTTFGSIVSDILSIAGCCSSFDVNHVKRRANMAAHQLAKSSSKYNTLKVWLERD